MGQSFRAPQHEREMGWPLLGLRSNRRNSSVLEASQGIGDGNAGGPERRHQASEQADQDGPDNALDHQGRRDGKMKDELGKSSAQGADAVAVEEYPGQRRPGDA